MVKKHRLSSATAPYWGHMTTGQPAPSNDDDLNDINLVNGFRLRCDNLSWKQWNRKVKWGEGEGSTHGYCTVAAASCS